MCLCIVAVYYRLFIIVENQRTTVTNVQSLLDMCVAVTVCCSETLRGLRGSTFPMSAGSSDSETMKIEERAR